MDKKFSVCEVVELGIQIEKNGKAFYTVLSEKTEDSQMKNLFHCLAEAESSHIDVFKNIFDSSCDYSSGGDYPDEYFTYMKS